MTTATIQPTVMRPVASTDDSFLASQILATYVGDEPWKLEKLVPGGQSFVPVAISSDGSAVEFDVFSGSNWPNSESPKTFLARLVLTGTEATEE